MVLQIALKFIIKLMSIRSSCASALQTTTRTSRSGAWWCARAIAWIRITLRVIATKVTSSEDSSVHGVWNKAQSTARAQ
jgi:hypothetical protein